MIETAKGFYAVFVFPDVDLSARVDQKWQARMEGLGLDYGYVGEMVKLSPIVPAFPSELENFDEALEKVRDEYYHSVWIAGNLVHSYLPMLLADVPAGVHVENWAVYDSELREFLDQRDQR